MYEIDVPIKNSEKDQLNRSKFVEVLSNSILDYGEGECLVIGLMGEWGCGKTSIINMVYEKIDEFNEEQPPGKQWIRIKFNPWYFSNQDSILYHFLDFLMEEFNKTDSINRIFVDLSKFKDKLSNFSFNASFMGTGLGISYDNPDTDSNIYKSFNSLKRELMELFYGLKYKIVISIDDIDRLSDEEMQQIFLLVKALADFPNVIYILSFDKKVALKALTNLQVYSPEKFLEKIIQIPIMVPDITKSRLELLIEEKIKPTYEKYNNFHFNDFPEVFEIIKPFFINIRDLKRYMNVLNFYINQFKEEVNIGDFIIIIAIQLFEYDFYLLIKENKDLLTDFKLMNSFDYETRSNMHDNFLNQIKLEKYDENKLNSLISHLFPDFDELKSEESFNVDDYYLFDSRLNVCSNMHFDKYFTLSTEVDEISQMIIDQLLILDNADEIYKIISEIVKNGKSKSLFEKIKSSTYMIDVENYKYFIDSLFKISNFTLYSQDLHELLDKLFDALYGDNAYILLKNAITYQSLYQVCKFIHCIGVKSGFYGGDSIGEFYNPPITLEQFKELKETALNEIIKCSNEKTLLDNPKGIYLLEYWRRWGDKRDVLTFVNESTNSDSELLLFIKKYQNKNFENFNDIPPQDLWKLFEYGELFEYLDEDEVLDRINNILKDETMSEEYEFCNIFIKWYNENGITIDL